MIEPALDVLVVEDDEPTRTALCSMLQKEGYRAHSAATIAEALDRRDWSSTLAVLLGHRLSDGSAGDALPRFVERAPQAAVLIVTPNSDIDGAVDALRAGADDTIARPIKPDTLRASLARVRRRRQLVEEIRQGEARWRKLVEAAGCVIVILRADHRIAYFGPFAEELTGYRVEEVLGRDYFSLFLPEKSRPGVAREVRRILAGGPPGRGYEYAISCRDGSRRWITWNAHRLDDFEGSPAVLAVGQDITQRVRTEAELRDRQARLASVLDTAVDGIITIDERGIVQSINAAAVRMFGYADHEVVGRNVKLLMPQPYRDQHDEYIEGYRRTGHKKIIGIGREVVGRRKDGSEFALDLAVSEVPLGDRRLYTGIIRDVTERKRAEAELRLLGTAIDVLAEGVMVTDAGLDPPGPRILFVNPAMSRITGYAGEELVGRSPRILQGPKTNRVESKRLRRVLLAGGTYTGQNVNYRKDGTAYDVELQISPVRDDAGQIVNFVSTHRDISQQKQAEERARQAERLAAIGQTVTGLAHESRNAFQRSQACLEMLSMELESRPELLELVGRTQKALDHLHHLYEEVRDYAAPINLDRQVCDLAHVWRDSWSHLHQAHAEKGVQLCEEIGGVDLACQVDWFAMGQVFRNVLENAIAACPDKGRIVVQCRNTRFDGKPALDVAIRDNGPGFDPASRAKVFEPFFTTKVKGTGLGMAIARRIVEAHGGQISLGDDGPGAEVLMTLPRTA